MANNKKLGLPGGPNEYVTHVSDLFSTEGYKRNSPDVNNPFNIIPSGNITMEGVDFPVYGRDNLGNEQIMTPGGNYQFPGDQVFEVPMAKTGGGLLDKTMKCNSCGWEWKAADGGADVSTCHKCGSSALPKAQRGIKKEFPKFNLSNQNLNLDERANNLTVQDNIPSSQSLKVIPELYEDNYSVTGKQPLQPQTGNDMVSAYDEPDTYDKVTDILASPLTSLSYFLSGQDIPDSLPLGMENRNPHDALLDMFNPFAMAKYAVQSNQSFENAGPLSFNSSTGKIDGLGEYVNAGLEGLGAIPVVPAWLKYGKYAKDINKLPSYVSKPIINNARKNLTQFINDPIQMNNPFGFQRIGDAQPVSDLSLLTPENIDLTKGFNNYTEELFNRQREYGIKHTNENLSENFFKGKARISNQLNENITPFGKALDSGMEGTVYEFANYPEFVLKHARNYSPNRSDINLPPEAMSFRNNATAIPLKGQKIFDKFNNTEGVISLMDNLNKVGLDSPLKLSKRDAYADLLKRVRKMRDAGIQIDANNTSNIRFNKDKGIYDIYDLERGKGNPNYMKWIDQQLRTGQMIPDKGSQFDFMYGGGLPKAQTGTENNIYNEPIEQEEGIIAGIDNFITPIVRSLTNQEAGTKDDINLRIPPGKMKYFRNNEKPINSNYIIGGDYMEDTPTAYKASEYPNTMYTTFGQTQEIDFETQQFYGVVDGNIKLGKKTDFKDDDVIVALRPNFGGNFSIKQRTPLDPEFIEKARKFNKVTNEIRESAYFFPEQKVWEEMNKMTFAKKYIPGVAKGYNIDPEYKDIIDQVNKTFGKGSYMHDLEPIINGYNSNGYDILNPAGNELDTFGNKVILFDPESNEHLFISHLNKQKRNEKIIAFKEKYPNANYLNLDNGRFTNHMVNKDGITSDDATEYMQNSFKGPDATGYNFAYQEGGSLPKAQNAGEDVQNAQQNVQNRAVIFAEAPEYTTHQYNIDTPIYDSEGNLIANYPSELETLYNNYNQSEAGIEDINNKKIAEKKASSYLQFLIHEKDKMKRQHDAMYKEFEENGYYDGLENKSRLVEFQEKYQTLGDQIGQFTTQIYNRNRDIDKKYNSQLDELYFKNSNAYTDFYDNERNSQIKNMDSTFYKEAQNLQRVYEKLQPNTNVEIVPIFRDPDTMREKVADLNKNDAMFLFGHSGGRLGGIPNTEIANIFQESKAENCYLGSCDFEENIEPYTNMVNKNLNYRPEGFWWGVNPNSNSINEAMWSRVTDQEGEDPSKSTAKIITPTLGLDYQTKKLKKGGGIEKYTMYKDYVNGIYTGDKKESIAQKNYDRLNRLHYREAKTNQMTPANYILSYLME